MPSAPEAHAHASRLEGKAVTGWLVDADQRPQLLARFPAAYANVVAHHVTLTAFTARDAPLPNEREGKIIGLSDDRRGVQALVVQIGGTTDRPDGSTYHITWSLERGRRAHESNDVIRRFGWSPLEVPVPVRLTPGIVA